MDKRALVERLKKTFPIVVYKKGMSMEDFSYGGGEQKVIAFIEGLKGTELSSPATHQLP